MKSAAVSTMKPMLGASLPRGPVRLALAMAWRSSLARVRQFVALGGRVLLRKVLFPWHVVGRGFDHETNVESFNAEKRH